MGGRGFQQLVLTSTCKLAIGGGFVWWGGHICYCAKLIAPRPKTKLLLPPAAALKACKMCRAR